MPQGVNDAHIQRYVQYCMRILSSRIQPLAGAADADHIKTLLHNKITQKSTTQQSARGVTVH